MFSPIVTTDATYDEKALQALPPLRLALPPRPRRGGKGGGGKSGSKNQDAANDIEIAYCIVQKLSNHVQDIVNKSCVSTLNDCTDLASYRDKTGDDGSILEDLL